MRYERGCGEQGRTKDREDDIFPDTEGIRAKGTGRGFEFGIKP